jgi:iron(III) transport system ATP-binding protein
MDLDSTVSLKNITKIFGSKREERVVAVDDFNININPGEMVTLLGPSGCGKTTTLRMIAGFETPTEGEIYFGGENVSKVPPNKRDTAMVFQSYGLFPHMTVKDNISYGLRFKDLNKAEVKKKTKEIMELVGLPGYEDRNPGELSGGQQQRVALARSLIIEPKVLLFDEPLSNLDAKLRENMRNEIRKLQRKLSITSIYVTHDQIEAMSLSDRIVVMNKGKIEQVGDPEQVYYRPCNAFVADFIGKVNFIPGEILEINGEKLDIQIEGSVIKDIETNDYVKGQKEGELTIVLRPESINICEEDQGRLAAKVIRKEYLGSYIEYVLRTKNENEITVNQNNPLNKRVFEIDENVTIDFEKEDLHLITK